uniref:Putative c2h2-type zn-finger protein n=1 Tax=Lutzomyia longipalpis TaxID=7200 RepID=A0A1B0GL11_LUTLO
MDYSVKDIIEDESDILQDKDEIMEIEEEFNDEIIERIIEAPQLESYDEVDVSYKASNTDQTAVKSHTESDKIYSIVKRSKNSSEDNHFCIQCKKDFSTKTNLRRHMLTHADQKPFQCSICGNGFTQKGSLKQHMHLHTGERPYKCTFCNDSFTQAKTLVNHIRRHTGEKPFPCPDCGISFRQKDGLKRHMTRHMETQKMYPCTICNKQLYSKYSLDNHIRKHEKSEGIVKLICSTCGCDFLNEKALEDHQRTSDECNQDCKITKKQDRVIINDPSDNSIEVLKVAEESLDSTSQSS